MSSSIRSEGAEERCCAGKVGKDGGWVVCDMLNVDPAHILSHCHCRLLRDNLEDVLGQPLPSREAAAGGEGQEGASAECAICYAYRLPPEDPEAAGEEEGRWGEGACDKRGERDSCGADSAAVPWA